MRRNIQGGGGGDAEVEDKEEDKDEGKDYYDYQDNSTTDGLWYKLQCDNVFAPGPRPLHNHITWIDLCLAYNRIVGAKHSTLSSSTSSLRGGTMDSSFPTEQFSWRESDRSLLLMS